LYSNKILVIISSTIFVVCVLVILIVVNLKKETTLHPITPGLIGSETITNNSRSNFVNKKSLCKVFPKNHDNSSFIADYSSLINDYHFINGYSDIRYNNDRTKATVYINSFINETEDKSLNVYYSFDGGKTYNLEHFKQFIKDYSTNETLIVIKVNYKTIGEKFLRLQPILFIWNVKVPTIIRNKHAIIELFGWDYVSILKEIDVIVKAGWTGIRLFPVFEHVMYLPNLKKNNNPWYTIYQPVSYNFNSVNGSREQLQQVINKANELNLNVYVDIIFNHTTYSNLYYEKNTGNAGYNTLITSGGVDYEERNNKVIPILDKTKNTPFDATKWQFPGIPLFKYNFKDNKNHGFKDEKYNTQCRRLDDLLSIELESDNIIDRQSSCLVDLFSRGISGFRFDASRHMNASNVSTLFNQVYEKMGFYLPDYHISWFEMFIKPGFPWEQEFNSCLNQNINKDEFKFWYYMGGNIRSNFYKDPKSGKATKQSIIQFDCHDNQSYQKNPCTLVNAYKDNVDGYINKIVDMFNNDDGISTKLLLSSFWIDKKDGKEYNFPNGFGTNPNYYISGYVPDNLNEMNKDNKTAGQFTRVHRDRKIVNAMNAYLRRK
jgi:hypothetical protein